MSKILQIGADGTRVVVAVEDSGPQEQPLPDLTPRKFAAMKAAVRVGGTRLTVVWDRVEAALDAADHPAFASVYADRFASFYSYVETVSKIESLGAIVQDVAGAAIDLDELRAAWIEAAQS